MTAPPTVRVYLAAGRLTPLGVQVVQYGDRDDRPVRTAATSGDVL
ncbi:MAG: hypothetical protein ACRCZP_00910 [Phycicoccus sp.]